MNKNQIIETAFETIKDSVEWGLSCTDSTYGHWIDGVVTVVDKIIDRINKENSDKSTEE